MKEWAPASTLPELASAAFAAEKGDGTKRDVADEDSFDARSTLKESRRPTLIGLTSPPVEPGTAPPLPVEMPAVGARPPRLPVTQIPPFGAPVDEVRAPAAPRLPAASAIPASKAPAVKAPPVVKAAPPRKPMTSDIDGEWATTTHSDEDETIPRRALPSELAAAAAAAAALRTERAKARVDAQAKQLDAPRSGAGPRRSDATAGRDRTPPAPAAPKADAARAFATKAPQLPPTRARVAAASASGASTAEPTAKTLASEPKPAPEASSGAPSKDAAAKAVTTTLAGVGAPNAGATGASASAAGVAPKAPAVPPPRPAFASGPLGVPVKPAAPPISTPVRIKPPSPGNPQAEPTAADARTAPAHATTLMGVSAPTLPSDGKGATEAARARPKSEITTTMVSPTEGIAEAEAAAAKSAAAAPIGAPEKGGAKAAAIEDVPTVDGLSVDIEPIEIEPQGAAQAAAAPQESSAATARSSNEPLGSEAAKPAPTAASGPLPAVGRVPEPARPPPRRAPPVAELPLPPASSSASQAAAPVKPAPSVPPSASTSVPPSASTSVPPAASASVPPRASTSVPPSASTSVPPSASVSRPSLPMRAPRQGIVPVPVSSLLGAGGVLIGMVVAAFFVGRASAVQAPRLLAKAAMGTVPEKARGALPPPPKPCWMVKQPAMWAPKASKNIPFEVTATRGDALAVGYARDAKTAVGIEVTLTSGDIQARFQDKTDDDVERIVPTPAADFLVTRTGTAGALKSPVEYAGSTPFTVGVIDGSISIAPTPAATPSPLWPVSGDEGMGAASVHEGGASGFLLTFRRAGGVWAGWISPSRKAIGELSKVAGSGGAVGKPSAGWNGREIAVIFADRPEAHGRYEIRIGHAPSTKVPATTTVLPLPRGGPGGDAFAPDIAGLPDGRWVIMWTEGAAGSRAVRAQTLSADFIPLGDPIALSPPAGNFGQGAIGITGGYAATVFLSKGSSNFELWGAVLQCQ
ncbi:Hypothetical protein A7982_08431 [Minicystis rosea]|nr:Hypothetical protein A7982_08431 [Minicystis rosea]